MIKIIFKIKMEITIKLCLKIYIFLIYIFLNKSKDISISNSQIPNVAILPFKLYLNPYKDDNNFFSAVNYLDIIHSLILK